jgi:Tol biopolymer transport system component
LAFQGEVISDKHDIVFEVFLVELPEDVTIAGEGPLAGTEARRPFPPRGTVQRRLTFTTQRKYPGIQGPRHWLHSSPNGEHIAFLMKDDSGVVQVWTISPNGGQPLQLTHNEWSIASAFSWSPDGRSIAHVMDNSVCLTELATGNTTRLTARSSDVLAPRPEACVVSPDGKRIAFVRTVSEGKQMGFNQIFVVNIY